MKKAWDFLRTHPNVAFATVENALPKIRVFEVMRLEGHTLYFVTAPHKAVYKQLQADPHLEVMAMSDKVFVRVSGKACFDVDPKILDEIYKSHPLLQRLYKSALELTLFKVEAKSVDFYDLSPTPPVMEHQDYV